MEARAVLISIPARLRKEWLKILWGVLITSLDGLNDLILGHCHRCFQHFFFAPVNGQTRWDGMLSSWENHSKVILADGQIT